MMEMPSICPVRYCVHQLCVTAEHLNVPDLTEELHLKFYFLLTDLNLNNNKWLVASIWTCNFRSMD